MKAVITDHAPKAIGPYSQAIIANGFVFCSGQVGIDPQSGQLVDGLENQIHQVMKNLTAVLHAAGSSLERVVKTTIFVTNIAEYPIVNAIYGEYFPTHKPARATVEVSKLPKGKLTREPLVEIEAVALV